MTNPFSEFFNNLDEDFIFNTKAILIVVGTIGVIAGLITWEYRSSWSADRKVHVGMTAEEVVALYGLPYSTKDTTPAEVFSHDGTETPKPAIVHDDTWCPIQRNFIGKFRNGILIDGEICSDSSEYCEPIAGSTTKRHLKNSADAF